MFRIGRAVPITFEVLRADFRDVGLFPDYIVNGESPSEHGRDGAVSSE